MAKVIMRNRVSTEYREVEADSQEFWQLRAELHSDGRPRWEQTGQHDAAAFADRQEAGALRDTDIGDEAQPLAVSTVGTKVETQLDYGWPTPGEIEQGAGRAADFDEEELSNLRARSGLADSGQGYPAGYPPTPPEPETFEERVEKGVSDEPLQTESIPATTEEGREAAAEQQSSVEAPGTSGGSSGSGQTNYSRMGISSLRRRADEQGVEVTRADGQEGEPLKSDYVQALEQHDQQSQQSEGTPG